MRMASLHLGGAASLQDAISQHHPGGFAADLAVTDLALADLLQVSHREPLAGDVEIGQLVADHGADEHHLDLLQARFEMLALRQAACVSIISACSKSISCGASSGLKVIMSGVSPRSPTVCADDLLEILVGQVVGEVEIGQVHRGRAPGASPRFRRLLRQTDRASLRGSVIGWLSCAPRLRTLPA